MTILYKLNNTNSVSWWKIEPLENGFITSWGTDHNHINKSLNEAINTDPSPRCVEDRIESEVRKKIARQGYSREIPTTLPELPMLAQLYKDNAEKAREWSHFCIQPKIDGHRCLATPLNMYTRRNTPITSCPHISLILDELLKDEEFAQIKLDGELFIPRSDLQTIQSVVRRNGPHPWLYKSVEYHIFDVVNTDLPFSERYNLLKRYHERLHDAWEDTTARKYTSDLKSHILDECPFKLVPTTNHTPSASLPEIHKRAVKDGYEGLIIRNPDGPYRLNYRSPDLLKYKDFMDTEFLIVGVDEVRNMCGVFVCQTPTGDTFRVSPAASTSFKRRIVTYKQNYIGKYVTVKYEKMSPQGIPLKPTAHTIHEKKEA